MIKDHPPEQTEAFGLSHVISDIPTEGRFERLMPAIGFFQPLNGPGSEYFHVTGWMLSPPSTEIETFALYVNQKRVAVVQAQPAPASHDRFRSKGTPKVFSFVPLLKQKEIPRFSRVEVLGFVGVRPVSRITTMFRADLDNGVPTPPEQLMYRVTGNSDGSLVKFAGLRCATDFLDAIGRYLEPVAAGRLLDWGCGCGRVTVHLIDYLAGNGSWQVYGCDIDGDAIDWCQANLSEGVFIKVGPFPPQPWADASFDLVLACSVFTHLTEETQQLWLREMQRVITPGGLFLASINSGSTDSRVCQEGISDETLDPMLDGIAPEGYYRGTVQSREYTIQRWAEHFEILDFIENGLEGTQDLVVMRKSLPN